MGTTNKGFKYTFGNPKNFSGAKRGLNVKMVICKNNNKVYSSISDVAKEQNVSISHISRCIRIDAEVNGLLFEFIK
ncbi:MAG: hypothetical protein RIR01_2102 [Bacteroidota bacterium]|jgi:hypothetical protein